jgi:hypothetical protein
LWRSLAACLDPAGSLLTSVPTTTARSSNNCNHFTNQLATLLTGKGIPSEYLTQHEVLLRSPMGQALMPMLMQASARMSL